MGLYATTFVVCLASAVFPIVSAEAYLLAVSAMLPSGAVAPLVLLSALGQMGGKAALYLAGRGVIRLPFPRHEAKVAEWRGKLESRRSASHALVFVSAFAGLPPFYAISILAGVLRYSPAGFLVWGFTGRLLRFGVVVAFPQVLKGLWA